MDSKESERRMTTRQKKIFKDRTVCVSSGHGREVFDVSVQ